MARKNYIYFAILVILAIVIISLIVGTPQQERDIRERSTTLIFSLREDYSGNYLGPITYYNETDSYVSSYTMALFDYCETEITENWVCKEDEETGEEECYCKYDKTLSKELCRDSEEEICFDMDSDKILDQGGVKKLPNNYYAVIYPSVEEMVERFAVLDKSIDAKSEGMRTPGDSIPMSYEEFDNYVLDENPLSEAYFCDEPQGNLDSVAKDLSQGKIPVTCKEII